MDDDAARQAKDRRRREDLLAGLRLEARLLANNPPPPEKAERELARRHDRIATLLQRVEDGDPDVAFIDDTTETLLRGELVRLSGGGGPQDDDAGAPAVSVQRNNTILYCERWDPTVRFYRDDLGLEILAENDWFVEFRVTRQASISIADASRATIDHVDGQGITLSWKVADVAATWRRLADRGLRPTDIRDVWDAAAFYIHDPEGHRIEIWADDEEPAGTL